MARIACVEVFAPDEIAIVHVLNRTVRPCFLMGTIRSQERTSIATVTNATRFGRCSRVTHGIDVRRQLEHYFALPQLG